MPTLSLPVNFLSMRAWLAQWPRRLQGFALALSLLAAIAPSWHVCALSGHSAGYQTHAGQHQFAVARNADGSPGPYICACASHPKDYKGNKLGPSPAAHDHVNCLALLLQNLPAQVAAPPALVELRASGALYAPQVAELAAFEAPLSQRGRAPPLDC